MMEYIALYFLIGFFFAVFMHLWHLSEGNEVIPISGWVICIFVWPYTLVLTIGYRLGWYK